ncbi:3'(2'),5'-bisphosphate nucleotidase CysQ [Leptolyngbya sp. 'hensonii']|nr:3'(2'),5'-bisphosphate nucleotidase CysQ [Leptolyngbya sp. 'hensonii']
MLTLARGIGWGAADVLMSYYQAGTATVPLEIHHQAEGPVTAADLAVNHYILEGLQQALRNQPFGYLSEETFKEQAPNDRLNHAWVWIIDPLDGTSDFIQRTGEFAIHIALAYQGRPVVAVVVWPVAGKLLYAKVGGGAFVEVSNGKGGYRNLPLKVSAHDRCEEFAVIVSRTHRDARFDALLSRLPFRDKQFIGSVGCKIAAIVEQRADVYISLSGKSAPKDWDMAAPELILTEAGGQFTYFDGKPLQYNREDVNQWGGLLASNGRCHAALCTRATQILADLDAPPHRIL